MSRTKPPAKVRPEARRGQRPKAYQGIGCSLSRQHLNVVLCVLLAAVTVALYSPVFGHPFVVYDDRDYVTANSHIHDGLSWNTIKWAFTSTEAANWHPLTWLSHALDYQLFALHPAGHHLDSVLIHALNAVLLLLLLAWATKRVWPSLLVAALFALHPLNVESVAWVAERKNVLSTLFLLLAVGAYGWYVQKPDWRRYLSVAALFAAGLMAKPMVITLPFVLLLLDYWPLERMHVGGTASSDIASPPERSLGLPRASFPGLVLEKVPLLFLSAASAWITLIAQRNAERNFEEFSLAVRVENAVVAYGLYLWKMVWPARLAFYPHSVSLPAWQWILSLLLLIGVTAFVVVFREKRYLPIGWFWFLGTLVPVIGLVQVGEYAMADRYAYVPLIGIFVMIAWGLADLAEATKTRAAWLAIPAVCMLVALGWVSIRQMGFWESDYDLWSHTLEGGETPLTHNALGVALMHPDSEMSQVDLESAGSAQNRVEEARHHFERALELRQPLAQHNPDAYPPDMARTLNNLGNIDRIQNRPDEARQHSVRALEIYRQLAQRNPDVYLPYLAATLNNLGNLDRLQNRTDDALQHYEEALKINRQLAQKDPAKALPNIALTLNEFGFLDASQNRMDEARQHYEEALKIGRQLAAESPAAYQPDLAMTLTNYGLLDASQNLMDRARQHYEEALQIDRELARENPAVYLPNVAMALTNLGRVAQIQNHSDECRVRYQEALVVLRTLAQTDSRYAGEAARVQASLDVLGKKASSR